MLTTKTHGLTPVLRRTLWVALVVFCRSGPFLAGGAEPTPSVSEACEVLRYFRGEYSYGGWGMAAQSNDGELAAWIVFHSPNATSTLVELYPQCERAGKAYVLATLFHADRRAFYSLTNAFCQEPGDIITASGCCGGSLTRAELVAQMQRSRSAFAFHPKEKPHRRGSLSFFGSSRDVYAEHRKFEEERKAEQERGEAALRSNAKLSVFTNAFRVEEVRDFPNCYSGVYLNSTNSWSANLVPKVPLRFPAKVALIFSSAHGIVEVGLTPDELLTELQQLTDLPFMKELDKELELRCVWMSCAGDHLHWNSDKASRFAQSLSNNVPISRWVQFSVDCGSPRKRNISFFHPQGSDIYVVENWLFESPGWRQQYTRLTGRKPKKMKHLDTWYDPEPACISVVNQTGQLRLFPLDSTAPKSRPSPRL